MLIKKGAKKLQNAPCNCLMRPEKVNQKSWDPKRTGLDVDFHTMVQYNPEKITFKKKIQEKWIKFDHVKFVCIAGQFTPSGMKVFQIPPRSLRSSDSLAFRISSSSSIDKTVITRLRQGHRNAHFPNPERVEKRHQSSSCWSLTGTFVLFRVSGWLLVPPEKKKGKKIKLDVNSTHMLSWISNVYAKSS